MSFWDYWILPVAHFLFFTLHLLTDTEVSCNRFSRLADATAACCRAPPEAPFVIPSEEVAKKLPDSREAFDFCVVVILPPTTAAALGQPLVCAQWITPPAAGDYVPAVGVNPWQIKEVSQSDGGTTLQPRPSLVQYVLNGKCQMNGSFSLSSFCISRKRCWISSKKCWCLKMLYLAV